MSGDLGDSLDLPFEASPPGHPQQLDVDAMVAGGVVVMAAFVPVPQAGIKPAIIYRFARPDGTFYPPMVLVSDDSQIAKLSDLTRAAVAAALQAAARARYNTTGGHDG